MVKHGVDRHEGNELDTSRYRMKIIEYTQSSFQRQIKESVTIQSNREENLLNSKAEYNRCALPRLTTTLGEKQLKERREEEQDEKIKEDLLSEKIRKLRKENSRMRRRSDEVK